MIFPYFFIQHSHTFHIWNCTLYPESIAQHHHQQWAQSPTLLSFFICKSTHFYIWECTLDPENSARCHHQQWAPLLSSQCTLQPCPSDCNRCKKITSFLLELGPLAPLQTRKIYPYQLSFTKYILRPCQHKNIFSRCDSDISGSTHQKYILTTFHWQNIFCTCDTDIIIFVWHFRVHVSKIYFRFCSFLQANIYRKYI